MLSIQISGTGFSIRAWTFGTGLFPTMRSLSALGYACLPACGNGRRKEGVLVWTLRDTDAGSMSSRDIYVNTIICVGINDRDL